jgi:nucleoside-diphosphate-sugar epimerase
MATRRAGNARIRDVGTRNLVAASVAAGATRFIAQSIAFVYAPGPKPWSEEMELDTDAPDPVGASARAIESHEEQILESPLEGIILRYGKFYGPGTWFDAPPPEGPLHVDDAAYAAFLALTKGDPGIYNIAEDDGTVSCVKAARELGWEPGFRI